MGKVLENHTNKGHFRVLNVLVIVLFGLFLLPTESQAKLPGKYEVIVPFIEPARNSADVVTIHEVFAFDCSHCHHYFLSNTLTKLKQKYGKQLEIYYMPIGWRGHDPGKLYFIAEENGKGEQVIGMIFDFIFEKGLGQEMFNKDKLRFVARMSDLSQEFKQRMDDPVIVEKMKKSVEFSNLRRIDSTPTIVVQDVLIANRDYDNLDKLIEAILR